MSRLMRLMKRIEESKALDRAAGALAELIPPQLRQHRVTEVLKGEPLGHAAHPVVVLLPVGLYAASAVLDLMPGEGRAAKTMIGLGLAVTPAAVATGLAEYTTLDEPQRRTAVAHLTANTAAALCYLTSYRLRNHGFGVVARAVGYVGMSLIGAGGYLGGHLTYRQRAGVGRWDFSPGGTTSATT
ncbi:DUF2231 domain-containing protein [Saccharothrix coeruleofusca]|uniref:DUF2231 domain-containing protein n=1 Tax=Saccharothrix coeruleofusca TaxID=33919 RepID=A0A918ECL2_9PSEU|nr:DUF2231 domain-containing protein [Saccharothrix coeruleofusca]MBP2333988.1 putative membrane protein [Saccharothrix coeruleofusca]GGP44242.1 hypothetical protein GCM10010185_14940 [Saccharothrix coeruleofusca]